MLEAADLTKYRNRSKLEKEGVKNLRFGKTLCSLYVSGPIRFSPSSEARWIQLGASY